MAATTNLTITVAEGYVLVKANPSVWRIWANSLPYNNWELVIAASQPAETVRGELHSGRTSYDTQGFTGNIYVRALGNDQNFTITE
jgi:hypothetical protein